MSEDIEDEYAAAQTVVDGVEEVRAAENPVTEMEPAAPKLQNPEENKELADALQKISSTLDLLHTQLQPLDTAVENFTEKTRSLMGTTNEIRAREKELSRMLAEISDRFEQDYANGFQDILDQQNKAYKAIFENAVKNYSKLHAAEEEWQKAQQRKAEAGFRKICEQQGKRFEYMMVSAWITRVLLVVILGMLWDK